MQPDINEMALKNLRSAALITWIIMVGQLWHCLVLEITVLRVVEHHQDSVWFMILRDINSLKIKEEKQKVKAMNEQSMGVLFTVNFAKIVLEANFFPHLLEYAFSLWEITTHFKIQNK